jgi:excisionase family DNA binding protein
MADGTQNQTRYISMDEALEMLGIKRSTMNVWIKEGKIRRYKHAGGKFNLFKLDEVLQLTEPLDPVRSQTEPKSDPDKSVKAMEFLAKVLKGLDNIEGEKGTGTNQIDFDVNLIRKKFLLLQKTIQNSTGSESGTENIELRQLLQQYLAGVSDKPLQPEDLAVFYLLGYKQANQGF